MTPSKPQHYIIAYYILLFLLVVCAFAAQAADVAIVRQALTVGTGTQSFTSSETWTPGAALFIVSRATTNATVADNNAFGVGCTDGTRTLAQTYHTIDGGTAADTSVWAMTDEMIALVDTSGNAIDFEATFSQWLTGGVEINIGNAPASAYLMTVILFKASIGGTGQYRCDTFTTNATQNATTDVTTVGFQPDTVWLFGRDDPIDDANHTASEWCMGIVDFGSSAQASMGHGENGGAAASQAVAGRISTSQGCYIVDNGGSNRVGAELSSPDSQGFTVTTRNAATAREFIYLAANWGTLNSWAGVRTTPTSTGNEAVTTPGFQPQFGLFLPSNFSAADTNTTDATSEVVGITAMTASDKYSTVVRTEDAATTMNTCSWSENVAFHVPSIGSGTCAGNYLRATYVSFDSTGWTLNWANVQGTARYYIVFMLEASVAATTPRSVLWQLMQ